MGVGEDIAITSAATGLAAGAKALELLSTRATLYVRMWGVDNDTSGASTNEDVSALKQLVQTRNKASRGLSGRAGQVVNQASMALSSSKKKAQKVQAATDMISSGFIPFDVQYNPASIRMQTQGGTIKKYTAMGEATSNAFHSVDKASATTLSVQLVFEDINNSDAFPATMLAEPNANASQIANGGTSVVVKALGGYSVRRKVEGMISLLLMERTRQVIFVWNDMFFHGKVIGVNAAYTMFNPSGNPIKATVDMQIRQTNSNASFKSDKQYWVDALDKGFSASLF